VATHLLFATVAMPHAVLIFISAAAGFALGVLLTMSLKARRKNIR
jgi:Lipopolysaccharide assembly protein A domain